MRARFVLILIVLLGVAGIVIAVRYINWYGDRAAWMTKAGGPLRHIQDAAFWARDELDDPPHHLLTLIWGEYLPPANLQVLCSATEIAGIPLDELTGLAQMDWSEFREFAGPLVAAAGTWQQVGDCVVSADIWTVDLHHRPPVVLGISAPCWVDDDLRAVIFSDASVQIVEGGSWIPEQNALRSKSGLATLPLALP